MNKKNHTKKANRGYILILALVFFGAFFTVSSAYLGSITSSARSARNDIAVAQALALAEAGIDNAIYQLNHEGNYSGEENTALDFGTYTVTVSNVNVNTKRLISTGYIPNAENPVATKSVTTLANINSSVVSFYYGAQVGVGGITMNNGSEVHGNLYSGGSITGSGEIEGDAISSGSDGLIDGVTVGGNARAHTLSNCTIYGDAYYQHLSNCSVAGTKHPGSVDPDPAPMPISDDQIDAWEEVASTTGSTIQGNYTISGNKTFGPAVFNGNLTINGTLTLSGVVWVKGNIIFGNNSGLTVSSSTGNDGAILIADVPGSESTKGSVTLSNNMTVSGNGSDGSFPMILSTKSGESGILMNNNADSIILYASNGSISISNNAAAKQITAYQVSLSNNATIEYESGLQNQSFSSGSGGSWTIVPKTYSISL